MYVICLNACDLNSSFLLIYTENDHAKVISAKKMLAAKKTILRKTASNVCNLSAHK